MKSCKKLQAKVFIPSGVSLEVAEKETAEFLANYFNCRVDFLENITDYKRKNQVKQEFNLRHQIKKVILIIETDEVLLFGKVVL